MSQREPLLAGRGGKEARRVLGMSPQAIALVCVCCCAVLCWIQLLVGRPAALKDALAPRQLEAALLEPMGGRVPLAPGRSAMLAAMISVQDAPLAPEEPAGDSSVRGAREAQVEEDDAEESTDRASAADPVHVSADAAPRRGSGMNDDTDAGVRGRDGEARVALAGDASREGADGADEPVELDDSGTRAEGARPDGDTSPEDGVDSDVGGDQAAQPPGSDALREDEKMDEERSESSADGNDADAEGGPHEADAELVHRGTTMGQDSGYEPSEDGAGGGSDDGYVHDIEPSREKGSTLSTLKTSPTSMKTASKTVLKKVPAAVKFKPYNPHDMIDMRKGGWRYGHCRSFGGRHLEYLRYQTGPWCPSHTAITEFKYSRCWHNHFRSMWRCANNGNVVGGGSRYYQTSCQWMRWANSEYLDRQSVRCPAGMVLSWFDYSSHGCWWHYGRYRFRCRSAETAPEVHRDSSCQLLRGRRLEYLDRQRPSCAANEVMTGFQLHSGGCGHNHMRYRTYCARVYQPWWTWGERRKRHYQKQYRHYWGEYVRKYQEYKRLTMPHSMSGRRIKRKYEYYRRMYDHYLKAYRAVSWERTAIKYHRLWHRYRRYRRKASEAAHYKNVYNRYHNKFLKATGSPPKAPVVTYPKGAFLGPSKPAYDKSTYWLRVWQDPPNSDVEARHNPKTVRKNIRVVQNAPKPACGKKCREQSKDIFSKVNDRLAGVLPEDPNWSAYPKALIRDPVSKQAMIDKALQIQTQDPVNNADIVSAGSPDGKAVAEATGCGLGDEDCLRKWGVWPGQVKSSKGAVMQTMKSKEDVYNTYDRAAKHLGDLVPEDPTWAEYPKSLVESRATKAYGVKSALDIKVNDPLDNADYGLVDGVDALPKVSEFRRELREHSGCDVGEIDCMDKFLKAQSPKPKK